MYLTAFPIQQTLVCYMPGMSVLANTALTFVINVLAAVLIYHLVEVPCTKFAVCRNERWEKRHVGHGMKNAGKGERGRGKQSINLPRNNRKNAAHLHKKAGNAGV